MLKRIITSVVAVCVLIPALLVSHTPIFTAAIALVALISVFEMLRCMGLHKKYFMSVPMYAAAVAMPFATRHLEASAAIGISFIAAALYLVFVFVCIVWSHGKLAFADGMAMFGVCLYIICAFCSILYVRDLEGGGEYIYLLIFMGGWITDIFAYFTGVFFGKHKLIEDVSPKKTVEGSIGGIIFTAVFFVVFGIVVDLLFERHANIIFLAVCGVVVSVISQVGDLIMSVIKRHYGIKDYGKLFPGHGGMLDRFDSVLAVSLGMCVMCVLAGICGIELL